MEGILFPVCLFLGLGALAAVILYLGAKYLSVPENELQKEIRDQLPGANCGACGYAGCDDYAANLANGSASPAKCIPGGSDVANKLAQLIGSSDTDVEVRRAFISCCGSIEARSGLLRYEGIKTCEACNLYFSGRGLCDFACLGFGDCAAVCPYGAIEISDDLAKVDRSKCVGCGLCEKVCPNSLIKLIPEHQSFVVGCSSPRQGAFVRRDCKNGCIGCGKCTRVCPNDAIKLEHNLAYIDGSKCTGCGACAEACPTKAIHKV